MENAAVLEIGVEDLPPAMVKDTLAQLQRKGESLVKAERIKYRNIVTWGTSRRLILYIEGVASSQEDTMEKDFGPPANVALTPKGELTETGRRYLNAKGATEEDLELETLEKGEYVYIKRYRKGKRTVCILPDLFKKLIEEIHFTKSMRWRSGNFSFGRPIRYITALLGEKILKFEVAGVKTEKESRGHRFFAPKSVEVPSASEYPQLMRKVKVIVDPAERKKRIKRQINNLISNLEERGYRASMLPDEELLEELTYLIEYPTVFGGDFDSHYLSLPSFILKECLREHQKHFAVVEDDRLLPFFIGVRDGTRRSLKNVVEGNRKVLHARFNDAQFFYQEDRRVSLEEKVPYLKQIIVQEKLGSYYDKVGRLMKLSREVLDKSGIEEKKRERIRRAIYLCKADLATNVVKEFPELQGIAGAEYALKSGEDHQVAKAIQEHRRPRFAGDKLPESVEGAILAILDKIDTLAGAFWAGFIPTGSEDPWGLRREAQGVIEIIMDKKLDLSLKDLIGKSMALFGDNPEAEGALGQFFKSRLITTLKDLEINTDKINAIMGSSWDKPVDVIVRARALQSFSEREEFREEVIAIVRLLNILKQAREREIKIPCEVKEEHLREREEKNLYKKWKTMRENIDKFLHNGEYVNAYKKLSALRGPIHDFFEEVLVMSDQPELKVNRLALLREIGSRFLKIADFTELQVK